MHHMTLRLLHDDGTRWVDVNVTDFVSPPRAGELVTFRIDPRSTEHAKQRDWIVRHVFWEFVGAALHPVAVLSQGTQAELEPSRASLQDPTGN